MHLHADTTHSESSWMGQTLVRIVSSLDLSHLSSLAFRAMEGGYECAEMGTVGRFDLKAFRWQAGSIMPLRGYADRPNLFRVVRGALFEYRFDPVFLGYRFRRRSRYARACSGLPLGGFHFLEAAEPALSIHAHSGWSDLAGSAVPLSVLPKLRDAFHRDVGVGEESGTVPPRLLAMLSGALGADL